DNERESPLGKPAASGVEQSGGLDGERDPPRGKPAASQNHSRPYFLIKNSVEFTSVQRTSSSASLRSPTFWIKRRQTVCSSAVGLRASTLSYSAATICSSFWPLATRSASRVFPWAEV